MWLYSWLTWLRDGSVKQRAPWFRCIKAEVKHRRMRKQINFGWPRDNFSPEEIINVKWNMQKLNWNVHRNLQKKKRGRGKLESFFLTQCWFNGRYPADFAFCYELHLKIYTVLIHRDLLACVVVNICHKSTWLWPTESTHYKDYCVACYYQESRELDNQPRFEKGGEYRTRGSNGILA